MFLQFKKRGLLILLSVIGFYIAFTIFFEFKNTLTNFQQLNITYVPLILILILLSIFCLSLRQHYFLKTISIKINIKNSFLIFLSGLTMLVTPGGSGEAVKSHYIKRNYGISYAKTLPIVLMERFHDLMAVIVITGSLLLLREIHEAKIAVILFSILLATTFIVIRKRTFFDIFMRLISKIKKLHKFKTSLLDSRETLLSITRTKTTSIGFGLSLIAWTLQAIAVYLCFPAFGIVFDASDSIIIVFTSLVLGIVSFLPAGIGVTEISMTGLLVKYGVEFSIIPSLVLFIRLVTIWFSTFVGFVSTRLILSKNPF